MRIHTNMYAWIYIYGLVVFLAFNAQFSLSLCLSLYIYICLCVCVSVCVCV